MRFDEAGVGAAATGIEKFLVMTTEIRKLQAEPATIIEEGSMFGLAELQNERSVEAEGRLENLSELVGMAASTRRSTISSSRCHSSATPTTSTKKNPRSR